MNALLLLIPLSLVLLARYRLDESGVRAATAMREEA